MSRGILGGVAGVVALGDCDGDGRLDAVNTGQANHHLLPPGDPRPPTLWRGLGGGSFERIPGPPLFQQPMGTAVFTDIDRDGTGDVVLAGPGVWWLRGQGGCRFEPARAVLPALDRAVALALHTEDIDLDGLTDLVLSRHGPAPLPFSVARARGDGTWDLVDVPPDALVPGDQGYVPYGLMLDDVDGDGHRDALAMIDRHQAWFSWGPARGSHLGTRDDALTDLFDDVNPMAIVVLDADRDGRLEYFVSGIQSSSLLLSHVGGRRVVDRAREAELEGVGASFAWGAATLDLDRDGWLDLIVLREDESRDPTRVHGPTDVFVNRGNGTFAELGPPLLGAELEAKALVCGDLDGDGDSDCIAMDRSGPVLLRNEVRPRQGWVGLRLRGTVSAPEANGARVTVLGASPPRTYYYGAHTSYAVEHPRDLVLATDAPSLRLRIEWPSGVVQETAALPAGAYTTVTEPEVLRVSRRVARADGTTRVEIAARASAQRLELAVEGVATLTEVGSAATTPSGSSRDWTLTAAQPGEVRLTLRLDGVALRVRPRVHFIAP